MIDRKNNKKEPTIIHVPPEMAAHLYRLWIGGPSKPPKIDDNDPGIWRRIKKKYE